MAVQQTLGIFNGKNYWSLFFLKPPISCWSCKVSIIGSSKESQTRMSDNEWRNMLKQTNREKTDFSHRVIHITSAIWCRLGQWFRDISTDPPPLNQNPSYCACEYVCLYPASFLLFWQPPALRQRTFFSLCLFDTNKANTFFVATLLA